MSPTVVSTYEPSGRTEENAKGFNKEPLNIETQYFQIPAGADNTEDDLRCRGSNSSSITSQSSACNSSEYSTIYFAYKTGNSSKKCNKLKYTNTIQRKGYTNQKVDYKQPTKKRVPKKFTFSFSALNYKKEHNHSLAPQLLSWLETFWYHGN